MAEASRLRTALDQFQTERGPLAGLSSEHRTEALVEQILESERRGKYFREIARRDMSLSRIDPDGPQFDPIKAALIQQRAGFTDEGIWLVFLFVHFGRSRRGGFRYARDVYGGAGPAARWDWAHVSTDVGGFRAWMNDNAARIRSAGPGGFGNHRKYESLEETGEVVATYVDWAAGGTQVGRIQTELAASGADGRQAFARLYRSMGGIFRFGRTARFDYLATLARLSLAPIVPDRAYLEEATGPARGAALLFRGSKDALHHRLALDEALVDLEAYLEVGFDTLEDAICNWQKSPDEFKPFRG